MLCQNQKDRQLVERKDTRSRYAHLSGPCPVRNCWSRYGEGVSIKQHTQQRLTIKRHERLCEVGTREDFNITAVWGKTRKKAIPGISTSYVSLISLEFSTSMGLKGAALSGKVTVYHVLQRTPSNAASVKGFKLLPITQEKKLDLSYPKQISGGKLRHISEIVLIVQWCLNLLLPSATQGHLCILLLFVTKVYSRSSL